MMINKLNDCFSLVEVVDCILDKGVVIDVFVCILVIGIELIIIEVWIVIVSVDIWLRYVEVVWLFYNEREDFFFLNNGGKKFE